ncbi:hypothetical protein P0F31_003040 [Vibrio metschnikovii]|nr:hypothetical protein [Vibrio metschnikovii]
MQKQIITSAIALTLFGCGGGESGNSGNPTPPVKNFNVNFLGLKVQSNETNCQIFGYNSDKSKNVIAFSSRPDSSYEIILHNSDGSVHKKYNNFSTTSFSFKQNEVPNNGYISFAKFNDSGFGISHVTTFAKELLPESLNIYAKGSATNNCLTPSSANPNPKIETGYINPILGKTLHFYSGFNTAYQNLDNLTAQYKQNNLGNTAINFSTQQRPFLAIQYATNAEGSELNQLVGFKFTTQKGSAAAPLELTEVTRSNAPWDIPNDLTLDSANLFVDGRQFNAPYAYLWQPLTTTQNGEFNYSDDIDDTNYYLNIIGKQNIGGQVNLWGIQHVAQGTTGTTNKGTSLSANYILADFPSPENPRLVSCQNDSQKQCLHITDNNLPNNTIQRIFIRAELNSRDEFVRQVFYTPSQNELPLMEFGQTNIDGQFNDLLSSSTSFMQVTQPSVKDAFLYQYQDLFDMTGAFTQNINSRVDGIPLLKNIAAQQDQQDLLKRQPYTWVWLEE